MEDWVVIKNTHEPLVSQEIWDKCREMENSVSQGKKTKKGETMPLSGLMFCADCGEKMRLGWNNTTNDSKNKLRKYIRQYYQCGAYSRYEYAAERSCEIHIYYKLLEKPLPQKKFLKVDKGDESKKTA